MTSDNFPSIDYFNVNPKGHRMKKHVRNNFPKFYQYLYEHYPSELNWMERLYWYFNNIHEIPRCTECGKLVKFHDFDKGYFQYCCQKCSNHSNERLTKAKNTIKEKYGVDNISQLESIKKKKEETLEKHYGVKYWLQSEESQKQIQNTIFKRYGVKFAHQSPEIKIKTRQTNIERYGGVGFESQELKEKTIKTNIERYGVENPYQIPHVIEKRKRKCIEKFGTENPFNSDGFKEWLKQYNLKTYGCKYSIGSDDIREKIKQTMLERYGGNSLQECLCNNEEFYKKCVEKNYLTHKKNNSFNTSKIEQQFKQWLDNNNINYKYQYRSEKYPFACDFYFPDKDLYLEIQGYWSHGNHPFNLNDPQDIETVKKWESKQTQKYDNAIETWTIRDPMKRQWSKDHNLNWCEVFTIKLDILINELSPLLF